MLLELKKRLQKITIVTLEKCSTRSLIELQYSNTFLDLKEHIYFVTIENTIVTSHIETLTTCVTRSHSNTFIEL